MNGLVGATLSMHRNLNKLEQFTTSSRSPMDSLQCFSIELPVQETQNQFCLVTDSYRP